jgi:hypothetical protein
MAGISLSTAILIVMLLCFAASIGCVVCATVAGRERPTVARRRAGEWRVITRQLSPQSTQKPDGKMDEATHRLQQVSATSHAQRQTMSRAVMVEAMRRAIGATKRAYQAQVVKIAQLPYRQIVAAAEAYVAAHPELIAEAKETVLRRQAEGMFGP